MTTIDLDTLVLDANSHAPGSDRMCVMERFWAKVDRREPGECWEWQASCDDSGYGTFRHQGKMKKAHRLAWVFCGRGPIPDGLVVMHSCDNPPCCNPAHLSVGTRSDNMRDAVAKGRHAHVRLPGEAHPNAKLTDAQVVEIRRRLAEGESQRALARAFGVSKPAIGRIARGRGWAHLLDAGRVAC